MEAEYIKYLWLAFLTLAQIVLVGIKIIEKRNNKKDSSNPVNLDKFHQEFMDFKKAQEKWNEKLEGKVDKNDDRLDKLEKR